MSLFGLTREAKPLQTQFDSTHPRTASTWCHNISPSPNRLISPSGVQLESGLVVGSSRADIIELLPQTRLKPSACAGSSHDGHDVLVHDRGMNVDIATTRNVNMACDLQYLTVHMMPNVLANGHEAALRLKNSARKRSYRMNRTASSMKEV